MSEDQAGYVTDALEMMGVLEPKQIVTEVSGFIPVFEVVLHHYKDYMTALVFGRMWQYCGMSDGVCKASLKRIGRDIEVSAVTVMRHAEKLAADGYLIDTTPNRRNAPHEYADGRKVEMKSRLTAGTTFNNATVIKSNESVIKSKLIKQDNTIIKEIRADALSSQAIQEITKSANKTVDAMLSMQTGGLDYSGREHIRADLLEYADWYNKTTGQAARTKGALKSWQKALGEWKEEGLTISNLQEAHAARSKWRTVEDPNELTKPAAAIHALPAGGFAETYSHGITIGTR